MFTRTANSPIIPRCKSNPATDAPPHNQNWHLLYPYRTTMSTLIVCTVSSDIVAFHLKLTQEASTKCPSSLMVGPKRPILDFVTESPVKPRGNCVNRLAASP